MFDSCVSQDHICHMCQAASLAHDVFDYYLSQSVGGIISCRPMQHIVSKFRSIYLYTVVCYAHLPHSPSAAQKLQTEDMWDGLRRTGP